MPAGNRTGPEGAGPMTGRALGYCVGNDAPGYAYDGPPRGGRGFGRGWGRGSGRGLAMRRGWGWNNAPAPEQTAPPASGGKESIRNEILALQERVEALSKRLEQE